MANIHNGITSLGARGAGPAARASPASANEVADSGRGDQWEEAALGRVKSEQGSQTLPSQ